ncbi:MAG: ABC transporter substrate-binding protein [Spirochaetales bacterium]|nr:ABC transporter substrate-binding protein [Spirochaetales bacterium]
MKARFVILVLLSLFLLPGCTGKGSSEGKIRIAEQYGLAYAPLQILREKGFLEEAAEGIEVEWVRLGNTAAIREAVLAGDLDIGFMGIPPFLIARDKGMEWKIATGLSRCPLGLAVPSGAYRSLSDIPADARIALPQPGSIQHILLSMALDRETGNPSHLDNNLIAMKHPDGMNALLSGAVTGHFTSPPYLFLEEEEGYDVLVSGEEAMGEPFTFIAGVATERFHSNEPDLYKVFLSALEKAILFIEENREETVNILSGIYDMDKKTVEDYLYNRGMVFEQDVRGLENFISFMEKTGYLKQIGERESVLF